MKVIIKEAQKILEQKVVNDLIYRKFRIDAHKNGADLWFNDHSSLEMSYSVTFGDSEITGDGIITPNQFEPDYLVSIDSIVAFDEQGENDFSLLFSSQINKILLEIISDENIIESYFDTALNEYNERKNK